LKVEYLLKMVGKMLETVDLPLFDMGSMMGGNKIGLFPELMAQPTEVTQLTEMAKAP
jgi:hypothetical protein